MSHPFHASGRSHRVLPMLFRPAPDRRPTAFAPNPTVWDYKLAQMQRPKRNAQE
jgi:hypothetical protein